MNKKKCLLFSFCVSDELFDVVQKIDPTPAIQTNIFGWNIARALSLIFGELNLISFCPVQNYPITKKIMFGRCAHKKNGIENNTLGFVNLVVLKHVTRLLSLFVFVVPKLVTLKIDWIFVHGLHSPYLVVASISRLFGVRVCVILTDPPGVVYKSDGFLSRNLKKVDRCLIKIFLKPVNLFIALSPDLKKEFCGGKPCLLLPGIIDSKKYAAKPFEIRVRKANDPFIIAYAGGLAESYGVRLLVDAVCGLDPRIKFILKIFGRGELESYVNQKARGDTRIQYYGFVSNNELPAYLKEAHLLVNARPSSTILSSMSFPSKLLEYLLFFIPVLTTRIKSIPPEMAGGFNYIEEEDSDGVAKSIIKIYESPANFLIAKCLIGRQFVVDELDLTSVAFKISKLIDQLNDRK